MSQRLHLLLLLAAGLMTSYRSFAQAQCTASVSVGGSSTICVGQSVTLTATTTSSPTTTVGTTAGSTAFLQSSYQNYYGQYGTAVNVDLPAGYVAVGFDGRTGSWMDQVQLAYRQLNADGTLGTNLFTTTGAGGMGGGPNGPYAFSGNTALVGATASQEPYQGAYLASLTGMGMAISDIVAGSTSPVASGGTFGPNYYLSVGSQQVPTGNVVTGFTAYVVNNYVASVSFHYSPITTAAATGSVTWSTGATGNSITVTPTEMTTYTATYQSNAGCTASGQATINVNPLPTPSIAVSSPALATATGYSLILGYGTSNATLTASGGVSYSWSPSTNLSSSTAAAPLFTPTAGGTYHYTVTATGSTGCTASTSVTIEVEDGRCGNNLDKVRVCHNGQSICVAPSAVPAHLAHGDYIGACTPKLREALGGTSGAGATELAIYPNPSAGLTTVAFRAPTNGAAQLMVYNTLGQRVATLLDGQVMLGEAYSLSLNGRELANGIYECRLVCNGKAESSRLVIAR